MCSAAERPLRWTRVLGHALSGALAWLCLLCGLLNPAWAGEPLRLEDGREQINLGPHLERWVDASGTATWDQAREHLQRGDFAPVGQLGSAGFTRAAHWFTLALVRGPQANERWILDIGEPYLDDVQVWLQRPDGSVQQAQMGDRYLSATRVVHGRQHAMGLVLPQQDAAAQATTPAPLRVWLRVRSTSAMNVSVSLWRLDAYFNHEARAIASWGLVIGLLLLATLTQLILGLWLRDRLMMTFAAYLGALCLLYSGLSGLNLLLLDQPPAWFNDLVVGGGNLLTVATASVLALLLLSTQTRLPRLRWLYWFTAGVAVCALPLVVTDHYGTVANLLNVGGVLLALLNMSLALWLCLRRPHWEFVLYTLASWSMGLGVMVRVLALLGLLPNNTLTVVAYPIGAVAYLVLMLLAMGVRVAALRHDKLLAQERAQEARRFAAIVAHEFRNPLAGIDRSANLLQLIPDLSEAQTEQRLQGIRRQVARLSMLIDSFLTAEAGEQRPLKLNPRAQALGPWLGTLHAELDDDSQARVQISVEPPQLEARFDAGLLALALRNLIDNALRYSPEHLPVQLRAWRDASDGALLIEVSDQGPGLSDDDMRLLGQPYHRGANALGRQGSGLGYYFCQGILHLHGGELSAHAVQPHGLAVLVRLPGVG